MRREYLISIAIVFGFFAILLGAIALLPDITNLITQIVAGILVIVAVAAAAVFFKGFLSKNERNDKQSGIQRSSESIKTFPNGLDIGKPHGVRKGVYYYYQKDMPPVTDMIEYAEKEIGAVLVTASFLTRVIDRDYEEITKSRKLTICIEPDEAEVLDRQYMHTKSPDLSHGVRETLQILQNAKRKITYKDNLIVLHHKEYLTHGIMVFDPNEENACVRIVEYGERARDYWESIIVFRKDNENEYLKYFDEYNNIVQNKSWEADTESQGIGKASSEPIQTRPQASPTFEAKIVDKKEVYRVHDSVQFWSHYEGNLPNAFFDNRIDAPEGTVIPPDYHCRNDPVHHWSIDPITYDLDNDLGKLNGQVSQTSTWNFIIEAGYPKGVYTIRMRLYYQTVPGSIKTRKHLLEIVDTITVA